MPKSSPGSLELDCREFKVELTCFDYLQPDITIPLVFVFVIYSLIKSNIQLQTTSSNQYCTVLLTFIVYGHSNVQLHGDCDSRNAPLPFLVELNAAKKDAIFAVYRDLQAMV